MTMCAAAFGLDPAPERGSDEEPGMRKGPADDAPFPSMIRTSAYRAENVIGSEIGPVLPLSASQRAPSPTTGAPIRAESTR